MKALSIILSFVAVFGLLSAIFLVNPEELGKAKQLAKNTQKLIDKKSGKEVNGVHKGSSIVVDLNNQPNLPLVKNDDPPINLNQGTNFKPTDPQALVRVELYTPDSSVKFAVGDLLTIPEEDQRFMRYLSLCNIPKAKRRDVGAVISFLVNSLGTRRRIYIPHFVGNSDETVIRLDTRDYEWTYEAWEGLATNGSGPRALPEPYFHTFAEELIVEKRKVKKTVLVTKKVPTGRRDRNGRMITEDKQVEEEIEVEEDFVSGKRDRTILVAPWLEQNSISTLMALTQSKSPMLRADWFVANASVPPAYYNFLKLGDNIKDFENLVFANQELAQKARSQDKGVVVTSIVARNNRTMTRSPTFTNGYYWKTHDSKTSVNDRQYVQNILNETFDASEDIGSLPNGLNAYFLADGTGKRLDFADPDIAIDNTAADRLVRTGRSCMICHADGIRPINDEIRSMTKKLQNKEEVRLLVTKAEDFYKIDDLFGSNLDEQIIKDQNLFRAAVAKANGLTSERNSKLFAEVYNGYAEYLLTREDISREVGIPLNELDEYIKLSNDNIILGLIKAPIRAVRRDQWEFSYHRFMTKVIAHKQGLRPIDPTPPGPLVPLDQIENQE